MKRAAIVGATLVVAVGCSGTSEQDDTTRDDSGSIVDEGEIGAFRIKVGDCLGEIGTGEFESAQGVPCEEAHQYEVYHSFELADGDFPGDAAVSDQAEAGCLGAFEGFVGLSYDQSIYGFTSLLPTAASWDQLDDREVLCLLANFDGTTKSGSASGSGL